MRRLFDLLFGHIANMHFARVEILEHIGSDIQEDLAVLGYRSFIANRRNLGEFGLVRRCNE